MDADAVVDFEVVIVDDVSDELPMMEVDQNRKAQKPLLPKA